MKTLSLFANIGVAEAYLTEIGVNVCVANELIDRRADLYKKIYPETNMICGDITNKSIFEAVLAESKKCGIEAIIATPPCQGMSRAAGIPKEGDERNSLILPVLKLVTALKPKYVFIENVKRLLEIKVQYNKKDISISDLLQKEFSKNYHIHTKIIDVKNFSIPQTRIRAIILMSRKDNEIIWELPQENKQLITLREAIGNLPSVDPFITDISEEERIKIFPDYEKKEKIALKISKWHKPPKHIRRQVITMMHTPSGKTAFDNKNHFPKKENGEKVRGYMSTYRRLSWDSPASTVTMDNRKISSQNNVHPGNFLKVNSKGEKVFSDARALTLYELMCVMTIPKNWQVPSKTPEAFLRSVIGEGIPPLFLKQVFMQLVKKRKL